MNNQAVISQQQSGSLESAASNEDLLFFLEDSFLDADFDHLNKSLSSELNNCSSPGQESVQGSPRIGSEPSSPSKAVSSKQLSPKAGLSSKPLASVKLNKSKAGVQKPKKTASSQASLAGLSVDDAFDALQNLLGDQER